MKQGVKLQTLASLDIDAFGNIYRRMAVISHDRSSYSTLALDYKQSKVETLLLTLLPPRIVPTILQTHGFDYFNRLDMRGIF